MENCALLVVDTQVNMFDEGFSVYAGDRILKTISSLINIARKAKVNVIFIRNNGAAGEPDEPGTPGWHIHPSISPEIGDLLIDKTGPDPFDGTDLQMELESLEVNHIIVMGMQTETCVSATVRQAVKLGYAVTLVEDGHTTFDWEEITAVEAIANYNLDLSKYADLVQAQAVDIAYMESCLDVT